MIQILSLLFSVLAASPAARAESVLQAYGRAHDAHFESGRRLGPDATPAQINAARETDYGHAGQAFHAEFSRIFNGYANSAKSALTRFNNSVVNMLKNQPADQQPAPVPPPSPQPTQQARKQRNSRPVTAAGGAKGADSVKFGTEKTVLEPVVIDGIVQDGPGPSHSGDPDLVDDVSPDAPVKGKSNSASTAARPHHAPVKVDDSGIIEDQ